MPHINAYIFSVFLDFSGVGGYNGGMKEFYVNEMQFNTGYADFDFQDKIKISSLFSYMQEVAGKHADKMGIGTNFLWPRGWGFIVTNNYLEIFKPIEIGEVLRVKTWPLPPGKVVFEREYEFYNEKGERVAAAVSRWCLLDVQNHKILSVGELKNLDGEKCDARRALDFRNWKIQPFDTAGVQPCFQMRVHSSEYDHYMHVNNTRYADFCMNCFSIEELKGKTVKSILISYEEQCLEGETLSFYRMPTDDKEFTVIGLKDDGTQFIRAKVRFL